MRARTRSWTCACHTIAAAVIGAAGVWGCALNRSADADTPQLERDEPPATVDGGPMPFDAARVWQITDDVISVRIVFDVERFLLPYQQYLLLDAEIWKLVDELRVSPAQVSLLRGNGLRWGVAGRAEVAMLRDVMGMQDIRAERSRQAMQSGWPLTLDLGSTADDQIVYTYDADGRMQGTTFDSTSKLLHVEYRVEIVEQTPHTVLSVTPELFKESEKPQYDLRDGQIRREKQYEGRVFRELSAEMDTSPGEAIVIGPVCGRRFTVGSTLLGDELSTGPWVTLLVIHPELYRNEATGNGP